MNIENFDSKKKYWDAFWQREVIDRPVICATAPKRGVTPHYHMNCDNISYQVCMSGDYESFVDSYIKSVDTTFFGGESIPSLQLTLGPDQYAAFLGAKITSNPEHATTWVHSIVDNWENFTVKIDDSPDSYFSKLRSFIEYAEKRSDDRYLVGMLDLHGNMDALSALRGPQNLCYDLIDCPEEVHRVLREVRGTFQDIFKMPYDASNSKHKGSLGWAPTYAPTGKFAVLQCDFSCMISPSQAREFVIPAIQEEASFLDHSVYHYDGKEALGHLDDILAIKEIDVIQWVPGDGQPRTIEWMDLLRKIQSAGKCLWIYDWTPEEIIKHHKELRPEGLCFSTYLPSQDMAEKLLESVKKSM